MRYHRSMVMNRAWRALASRPRTAHLCADDMLSESGSVQDVFAPLLRELRAWRFETRILGTLTCLLLIAALVLVIVGQS